jgi:hypothetical protein
MTDKNSAEYYANPENRRVAGPARRREARGQLSNHVPIRFSAATMAVVRLLAYRDGMTVSSWVRAVVEREVERRLPFARTGMSYELHHSLPTSNSPVTSTNPGAQAVPSSLELVAS